jgi:hypothetical protein
MMNYGNVVKEMIIGDKFMLLWKRMNDCLSKFLREFRMIRPEEL